MLDDGRDYRVGEGRPAAGILLVSTAALFAFSGRILLQRWRKGAYEGVATSPARMLAYPYMRQFNGDMPFPMYCLIWFFATAGMLLWPRIAY